jgi:hypothetical protein
MKNIQFFILNWMFFAYLEKVSIFVVSYPYCCVEEIYE